MIGSGAGSERRSKVRRWVRGAGFAAAVLALLPATSAGIAVPPVAAAFAAGTRVLDALGVIDARSPGTRAAGAFSIKGVRKALADSAIDKAVPVPRSLPSSVELAPLPAAVPLPEDVPPVATIAKLPVPVPATPLAPAGFSGGGGPPPVQPLGITVPGSNSGGGGGGPGVVIPPRPPVSVPEPDQWAMLMVAFALLGALQRRRNRRDATA